MASVRKKGTQTYAGKNVHKNAKMLPILAKFKVFIHSLTLCINTLGLPLLLSYCYTNKH